MRQVRKTNYKHVVFFLFVLTVLLVPTNTSEAITSNEEAQTPVWRIQLRVVMADVKDAGTDNSVGVILNSKTFWLDYGRNDFERDSSFLYDVGLDDVNTLADIKKLTLKKTGGNGMGVKRVELYINGQQIYERTHPAGGDCGCWWITDEQFLKLEGSTLRGHPKWQSFVNPPVPSIISKAEMESRIEALFGNVMHGNKLYWDVNSGKEVEISKKNSNTYKVDLDLKADVSYWFDPKIDTDFDLKFVCQNNRLEPILERFDADSDYGILVDFVTNYITGIPFATKIIEQIIDQIVERTSGDTSVASAFAETKCVDVHIHDNGNLEFIVPATAVRNGDWNDPQTWHNNKVPSVEDDKTIPRGISVTISSSILNYETITNYGTIVNTGTLENKPKIKDYGLFSFSSSATITNYGTITNSGYIKNTGTITNSGTINIECGGSISGIITGNPSINRCIETLPAQPTPPVPITDIDNDGIADKDDACPSQPETKNGYQDTDGCPDVVEVQRRYDLSVKTGLLFMTHPYYGGLSENQVLRDGNKFQAGINFYNTGPNDAPNVVVTIKSNSNWIHIDSFKDPNCAQGSSRDEIVCKYRGMGVNKVHTMGGVTVNFRVEKAPEIIGNSISVVMTSTPLANESGGDTKYANNELVIPFQIVADKSIQSTTQPPEQSPTTPQPPVPSPQNSLAPVAQFNTYLHFQNEDVGFFVYDQSANNPTTVDTIQVPIVDYVEGAPLLFTASATETGQNTGRFEGSFNGNRILLSEWGIRSVAIKYKTDVPSTGSYGLPNAAISCVPDRTNPIGNLNTLTVKWDFDEYDISECARIIIYDPNWTIGNAFSTAELKTNKGYNLSIWAYRFPQNHSDYNDALFRYSIPFNKMGLSPGDTVTVTFKGISDTITITGTPTPQRPGTQPPVEQPTQSPVQPQAALDFYKLEAVDMFGNPKKTISAGESVIFRATIKNNMEEKIPFAYVITTTNFASDANWQDSEILPRHESQLGVSHTFDSGGNYRVKAFLTKPLKIVFSEGIDYNKFTLSQNQLAAPLEISINVEGGVEQKLIPPETIPTQPRPAPKDDVISEKETMTPSAKIQISLPKYKETKSVPIKGQIQDYTRGSPIEITITKPDGTTESIDVLGKKTGEFEAGFELDHDSQAGQYKIEVKHDSNIVDSFNVELVSERVPSWIKNNAKWWSEGSIDDDSFVQGIEFLIKEKIVKVSGTVPLTDPPSDGSLAPITIPTWIKNNAKWWSEGTISEDDFVAGLEFLIKNKIIRVN